MAHVQQGPRAATPEAHPASDSGSTTNPNTPRSSTPDEPARATAPAPVASPSKSTSSSSPDPRKYDIKPSLPTIPALNLTKVPAAAVWDAHRLPRLFLDMHWQPASNAAFFRLRHAVPWLDEGGHMLREGKNTYLFVYPERIAQLSIDHDPTEKPLGADTISIRFDMNRPPALVLPKTACRPKGRAATETVDLLRRLACQNSFTIHASIPARKFSPLQKQKLCEAVSSSGIRSIVAHASEARLYQGQGGRVLEGDSNESDDVVDPKVAVVPESGVLCDPPPQYNEASLSEPQAARATSPTGKCKKRRRLSISSSSSSSTPKEPPTKSVAAETQSAMGLSLAIKSYMDDRLAAHEAAMAQQIADVRKDVGQMLVSAEARILETLRRELDERCDGMHEDLDDRVHREVAEMEDDVMRRLTDAPLQARLTFPQHPWY